MTIHHTTNRSGFLMDKDHGTPPLNPKARCLRCRKPTPSDDRFYCDRCREVTSSVANARQTG